MNIDINTKLADVATRLATANSTTPELYLQGVVESHLVSALRDEVTRSVTSLDIDSTVSIKESIDTQINPQPAVIPDVPTE